MLFGCVVTCSPIQLIYVVEGRKGHQVQCRGSSRPGMWARVPISTSGRAWRDGRQAEGLNNRDGQGMNGAPAWEIWDPSGRRISIRRYLLSRFFSSPGAGIHGTIPARLLHTLPHTRGACFLVGSESVGQPSSLAEADRANPIAARFMMGNRPAGNRQAR